MRPPMGVAVLPRRGVVGLEGWFVRYWGGWWPGGFGGWGWFGLVQDRPFDRHPETLGVGVGVLG